MQSGINLGASSARCLERLVDAVYILEPGIGMVEP